MVPPLLPTLLIVAVYAKCIYNPDMSSSEQFVHPTLARLPEPFVRSLVAADLLPADVAFRSQWLPQEIGVGNDKIIFNSDVLQQDILSTTGHIDPTEYYGSYLDPKAKPPACVTIRHPYKLRETVATSDTDWHLYGSYRSILAESGVRNVDAKARTSWHNLILTCLRNSGDTLDWAEKSNPLTISKKSHEGDWLRRQVATTVLRDDALLALADRLGHDTQDLNIRVNNKQFNALHVLLADNHPNQFMAKYADWHEATDDYNLAAIASMDVRSAKQYFADRAPWGRPSNRERGWLSSVFGQAANPDVYDT